MAVNRGLLLSAAVANTVNSFMDAREKGDLQRQRQAMADIDEQYKQSQLDRSRQLVALGKLKLDPIEIERQRNLEERKMVVAEQKADGTATPSPFQKAHLDAERAFEMELNLGNVKPEDRGQYIADTLRQDGYLYDKDKAAAEKAQNLEAQNPIVSIEERKLYSVGASARREDLQGLTPSDPRIQFDVKNGLAILTDEADPRKKGGYEVVKLMTPDGRMLDRESAGSAVSMAMMQGRSYLQSSNRTIRNHIDIATNYQSLRTALQMARDETERAKRDGDKPNYVAIDQTITTTFIKMLDPGSVVREQEYKRLLEDMGLTEQWIGKIGNLSHGGYLSPNSREAVARMGAMLMKASELNRLRHYISVYGQVADASAKLTGTDGEEFAHLATGRGFNLSDGTRINFKGEVSVEGAVDLDNDGIIDKYEKLTALHQQKKNEWLESPEKGGGNENWEDFRKDASLVKDLKEHGHKRASSTTGTVDGMSFLQRTQESVKQFEDTIHRLTGGYDPGGYSGVSQGQSGLTGDIGSFDWGN